ncbi:MAG: TonB family protein [Aquisalimonadaceae bacterium]
MSQSSITNGDRLGMTLFMAAAAHVVVILGVGFSGVLPRPELPPLIEITLTQSPSEKAPEDYDFLAPDDQDGGGSAEEAMRPTEQSSLVPDPRDMQDEIQSESAPPAPATTEETQVVTTEQSEQPSISSEQPQPEPEAEQPQPLDLVNTRQQVARDIADTTQTIDWDARYPSKQRINARTRSHAAAAYMKGWIEKVEQVGNLNYPDEARRRQLTGQLIVEVTVMPDGSVEEVRILQPSRYRLLDEAAVRVVELAAPYARVPPEVLEGKSRLVITRTWEFVSGAGLQAR